MIHIFSDYDVRESQVTNDFTINSKELCMITGALYLFKKNHADIETPITDGVIKKLEELQLIEIYEGGK